MSALPKKAKRLLRSPKTIFGEVAAIALAAVAFTIVPQVTERAAARRFAADHPDLAGLTRALALDRVLWSPWFLALVLLAGASLSIVLVEQWRRLLREWREPLTESSFRSAPFRREVVLPAPRRERLPRAVFRTTGRAGLLGSPLFHLGLMVVIAAALTRALFASEGIAEVVEGQTLEAAPGAFPEQWRGALAPPFALAEPARLERLRLERYPSGDLLRLSAELAIGDGGGKRSAELAINAPLELAGDRLYLGSAHGVAALLEVGRGDGPERHLLLLREGDGDVFEASAVLGEALQVRLRARLERDGGLPANLEARVLQRSALLFVGRIGTSREVRLASGGSLRLHGIRRWALFQGSRDRSQPVAYLGFFLAGLGAVLMFTVVKVDTAVVVTPAEGGERVLVALKAQRFAPIFAERFERLARQYLWEPGVS